MTALAFEAAFLARAGRIRDAWDTVETLAIVLRLPWTTVEVRA